MKNEFKAGYLVFEVVPNRKIRLVSLTSSKAKLYPVRSDDDSYTEEGYMLYDEAGTPSLFHATSENRQALVTLYGEDAVPKIPLRGSELTKKLLENQKYVLCFCSDTNDDDCRENKKLSIISCFKDGYFYNREVDSPFADTWRRAVPVDNNGNEITEIE